MLPSRSSVVRVTFLVTTMVCIHSVIGGNAFCSDPIDSGPCRAVNPSWGYQCSTKECVSFNYGGCQGNDNIFPSEEDCEQTCQDISCSNDRKRNVKMPDSCIKPVDSGTCHEQNATKWAYNCWEKECKEFTYGGCGGNDNNFDNKELCELSCGKGKSCPLSIPDGPGSILKRLTRSVKKKPKSEDTSGGDHDDDTSSDSSSTSMSYESDSDGSEESSSEEQVTSNEGNSWKETKSTRKVTKTRNGYSSHSETNTRSRTYS